MMFVIPIVKDATTMEGHFSPDSNPNSANQTWSRWTFKCFIPTKKSLTFEEILLNWRKFCPLLFKTHSGRLKLTKTNSHYKFVADIEGVSINDPLYRADVKMRMREHFIRKGLGNYSANSMKMESSLLSGSAQDGTPPVQLIVLPEIRNELNL